MSPTLFWQVFRLQVLMTLRTPDTLHVFVTAPLYTCVFLAITEHAERRDLAGFAVLAPVLMSLWSMALMAGGELIGHERERGTLEAVVATPARYSTVVTARITAVTLLSTLSLAEAWLVAWAGFGITVTIARPLLFAVGVLLTALAMAGTASCVSALFVLAPSARILQNTLSFPFFLLGGVLVPVSVLPQWLQPASKAVFLSWSADVLRTAVGPAPDHGTAGGLLAVVLLGLAGHAAGTLLIDRILRRVRVTGTLARM
ncbi:ABC transporter permease [Streptomyces sp. NPDC001544]|uniref:ABC transporter permease n=1 Tax=Streptomyces sp. NPDC001544 TaxID=3364584 RepID=UPI003675B3D0